MNLNTELRIAKEYAENGETEIVEKPLTLLDDAVERSLSNLTKQIDTTDIILGKIINVDTTGFIITFLDNPQQHVNAMSLCSLTTQDIGKVCAIKFLNNDINQPLIMGLVHMGAVVSLDNRVENLAVKCKDGITTIKASKELVLVCGESRIVMTSDGVIQIRGLYIDSHAKATQRIKGGSVKVN